MQKFNGSLVRQFPSLITGNAAAGVTVNVYVGESGSTLQTTVVTDDAGYYSFTAPDGIYRLSYGIANVPDQIVQLVDVAGIRSDFDAIEASNAEFLVEQQANYDAFVQSQGWDQVGTFAVGFTFTSPNQVGQDDDGNWWRWNGALDKVVAPGTNPESDADYKLVGDGVLRSDLSDGTAALGGSTSGDVADSTLELHPNKELVDVFIIYGQSNAKGSANATTGRQGITDKALYWSLDSQDLLPLTYTIESTSTFGGEVAYTSSGHAWGAFANKYAQLTGRRMVFVPGAIGGTSIAELSKDNPSGIYSALKTEYDKAIAEIEVNDWEVGSVCVLWHHGETNQASSLTYAEYKPLLETLMADMLTDFDYNRWLAALVGLPPSRTEVQVHGVRNSQIDVFDADPRATVAFWNFKNFTVNNGLLQSDDTHATQRGYNVMGRVMAESAASLLYPNQAKSDFDIIQRSVPEYSTPNRVKQICANIRLSDSGATLLTKDNNSDFLSSNVTGVSASGSLLTIGATCVPSHKILSMSVNCLNESSPQMAIDARVIRGAGLVFNVRLSVDYSFVIDTDAGALYQNEQLAAIELMDSSSLSIADGGTYWTISHNSAKFTPMITRLLTTGTSDEVETVRPVIASASSFRVLKSVGMLSCLIPSMTIRPNEIKAGTSLLVNLAASVSL
jgi:hypothetical protein